MVDGELPPDQSKSVSEDLVPHGLDANVRVETVRFRDIRALVGIQRQSFGPRLAYGWSALTTLMLWPSVAFLVAHDTESHRVVGCGIADRTRGSTRVMNLAIQPEWRRRGVGRALLRALGEALPDGDITLMVQEHNTGAQKLYLAEGFVRAGVVRDYYGTGQHGISMRKSRYPDVPPNRILT